MSVFCEPNSDLCWYNVDNKLGFARYVYTARISAFLSSEFYPWIPMYKRSLTVCKR
ncbi:hypothetical protein CARN8_5240001 [mine drainage metagenome]|uniref:Uncharacterized protein n=1 Tax=mine drainage metagenome TaxID=410659 RepID=A0A3P3ZQ96_9ZZZZ